MSKILNSDLLERLLFTAIVIGILMAGIGGFRFLDLSNRITSNEATQVRESGEEVSPENTNEAFGLMKSDLERRRMVEDRFNMMIVGGVGLALIGIGWMATDLLRSRRKKEKEPPAQSVAGATS